MQETHTPTEQTSHSSPGIVLRLWRWFWRLTLVVSLAYAWHCFYVPSNSIVWANDYTSAQREAVQSGKPIILYFTGKWCVPCRIMKRKVWADQQVTAVVNAQFIPVEINVDNPDSAAVLARYKVLGSPVTIITDPQGNVMRWRDGRLGKTDFLTLLGKPKPSSTEDL